MHKKIVVHYRNGYGLSFKQDFDTVKDYLDWKRGYPELFNTRNDTFLEITKVTTLWLPIKWSDFT